MPVVSTEARVFALEQQIADLLPLLANVIAMNKLLCEMLMTREQDAETCH